MPVDVTFWWPVYQTNRVKNRLTFHFMMMMVQFYLFTASRCIDVGTVKYGARQGSGTSYGSSVSFSCNSGYAIVGSTQRTCQQGGIWSGQQPRCVRE